MCKKSNDQALNNPVLNLFDNMTTIKIKSTHSLNQLFYFLGFSVQIEGGRINMIIPDIEESLDIFLSGR